MGRWTKRSRLKRSIKQINQRLLEQEREVQKRAMKYLRRMALALSFVLGVVGSFTDLAHPGKVSVVAGIVGLAWWAGRKSVETLPPEGLN